MKSSATLDDVVLAQEVDINYAASVEGVLIPSTWVQAAIDAHKKLQIEPTGDRIGGLDVADEGKDKNSFAARHGVVMTYLGPHGLVKAMTFWNDSKSYGFLLREIHRYAVLRCRWPWRWVPW